MDDDAKSLRQTLKKPTLEQIKKAAARVIKGSRDAYGRKRIKQKGFQNDLANLRGLRYKTELAEQLENDDNNKTNEANTMTQAKTPAVEVLSKIPAAEPPDLLKEIEQAKSNAKKQKDEIDRELQIKIEKLAIPLKKKLVDRLFDVCEIIKQLDHEDFYDGEYLKDEEYKHSVAFLKNRFAKKKDTGDSDSGIQNGNAGKPKPGKKINSAIKRAGKAMTPDEIAKETGVDIEFVKSYLTSGESSIRYEKDGDGYNIRKK
jgi:hypothetical protein